MSRLTRDGTAEPVSRDQILRHARGQGNVHFPCSTDHEQDWQPYPVDPYSAICDDHTYILILNRLLWLQGHDNLPLLLSTINIGTILIDRLVTYSCMMTKKMFIPQQKSTVLGGGGAGM